MKRLIWLLPLLVLLCGCYPYTEIENMDILTSVYIGMQDDDVLLGGGVANVRSFADAMADKPVSKIYATGEDLEQAVLRLQQSADHPLFFGAMRAAVVQADFAQGDILPFLRYLDAEPRSRRATAVFVTEAELDALLECETVNDFSAGFAADSIITSLYEEKLMHYTSLGDVLYATAYGNAGYMVPHIAVTDGVMRIDGYGLFQGGKLVGDTKNATVVCFMQDGAATNYVFNGLPLEARLCHRKLDLQVREGKLYVRADFVFAAQAQDATSLRKEQLVELKKRLRAGLSNALEQSRMLGCDFLQLYKTQMMKGRAEFDMDAWNGLISDMEFEVNVEVEAR